MFRENQEFAPFIHRHQSANGSSPSSPQGYIPALLKYFVDDHHIKLEYVIIPRNRVVTSYAKKELDASILSKRWVDNPDDFVFSQPLGSYRSVLFARSDEILGTRDIKTIKSQYICARRGYRYPELQHLWGPNNLVRVDFSDEYVQLQGLEAGRCQYAVLDESVARWYIKKHFKKDLFRVVAEESVVPLTIGFRKDKAEYAAQFDQTIQRLKSNGELGILQQIFGVKD